MEDLKPGDVVVIGAFDDWPEQLVEVDEAFEDCVSNQQKWSVVDQIRLPARWFLQTLMRLRREPPTLKSMVC